MDIQDVMDENIGKLIILVKRIKQRFQRLMKAKAGKQSYVFYSLKAEDNRTKKEFVK